jgi:hypothetical protein
VDAPAQAPYEIARYLSDEAKRAAVARTYAPRPFTGPRCADGFCPLGVALKAMEKCNDIGEFAPAPDVTEIASLLDSPRDACWDAACRFIVDWDGGRITDLAAALGVS